MRKRIKNNGFAELVFEKGDGVLKRWSEPMQSWRLVSPENRKLTHAFSWYLDEENVGKRPTIGLLSLAYFAEKLLYNAYKSCPGTRACAKAQRLFVTIRRKMAQMKYRGDNSGRLQTKVESRYMKSTVKNIVVLAKNTFEAIKAEKKTGKTTTYNKAIK